MENDKLLLENEYQKKLVENQENIQNLKEELKKIQD